MIGYLNSTGKCIKINKKNKWSDYSQVKYVKTNFYLVQQVPKKDIGKKSIYDNGKNYGICRIMQ